MFIIEKNKTLPNNIWMELQIFCPFISFKKLPNPVFSRLMKEVARRDEIIRQHLNQYKVCKSRIQLTQ